MDGTELRLGSEYNLVGDLLNKRSGIRGFGVEGGTRRLVRRPFLVKDGEIDYLIRDRDRDVGYDLRILNIKSGYHRGQEGTLTARCCESGTRQEDNPLHT